MGNQLTKGKSWNTILYSREIQFLKNHGVEIIKTILSCYAENYSNLYSETTTDNPIGDCEIVFFEVCRILNTTVWPQSNDSNKDEEILSVSSLQSTSFFKDSRSCPFLNLLRASRY